MAPSSAPEQPQASALAAAAGPGTKSVLGLTLVSLGLDGLDKLLGGGIPLGGLVVVLEVRARPGAVWRVLGAGSSRRWKVRRGCECAAAAHASCSDLLRLAAPESSKRQCSTRVTRVPVPNPSQDTVSPHHRTLLSYFVAEGAACEQQVLVATGLPRGVWAALPRRVTRAAPRQAASASAAPDEGQHELRIAWQYRR